MFKHFLLVMVIFMNILEAKVTDTECLCLKVDKSLAKELKALIVKHGGDIKVVSSSSEDISDKVIKKIEAKQKQKLKKEKEAIKKDLFAQGKELFINKCQSCHGDKGQEEAYGYSRALNSLTLDDMEISIRGYNLDEYDRGMAMIMKPNASGLTEDDIKGVYQYIQSLKN